MEGQEVSNTGGASAHIPHKHGGINPGVVVQSCPGSIQEGVQFRRGAWNYVHKNAGFQIWLVYAFMDAPILEWLFYPTIIEGFNSEEAGVHNRFFLFLVSDNIHQQPANNGTCSPVSFVQTPCWTIPNSPVPRVRWTTMESSGIICLRGFCVLSWTGGLLLELVSFWLFTNIWKKWKNFLK